MFLGDDDDGEEQTTITNVDEVQPELIWYQNIRSLTANFDKFRSTIMQMPHPPIVIALQEIWAPKSQHHTMQGYHKLIHITRKNKRGGGVGYFINNNYNVEHIKITTEQTQIEHIWVYISETNTIFGNIYRPPSSDVQLGAATLMQAINEIQKIALIKNCNIIIGGDFNVNFLDSKHNNTIAITDVLDEKGFMDTINQPTRVEKETKSQLDNIFIKGKNTTKAGILLTDISDHLGIYVCLKPKKKTITTQAKQERCFNEKNMNTLKQLLQAEKWELLHKTYNNDCFNIFKNTLDRYILLACINTNKPTIRNRNKHPEEPWMTKGILTSRRTKNSLYKKYLNNSTMANYNNFKKYQKCYYKAIKGAKKIHINKMLQIHHGDGKKIWGAINQHTNRIKNNTPPIKQIISQGVITEDSAAIANEFNKFFSEVGENLAKKITIKPDEFRKTLPHHTAPRLIFKPIQQKELQKIINKMEPKTSSGHDHISNKILKELYPIIQKPLLHVLNRSIINRHVPESWKYAKVVPLHKKGSTKEAGNYRPISLLPTISKVIEKIIEKQTRDHLEQHNLITPQQFGFRPAHETTHAVLKATEYINKAWDRKHIPLAVFCDLKKAFDTVNFNILLSKIEHYNIDATWFRSYLHNRKQFTTVNGTKSNTRTITCGVPQGSILGPLLFLLYINDLPRASHMSTILFADDTTLLTSAKTEEELIEDTNKGLRDIAQWFHANGLTAHPEKTTFMVFNYQNSKALNGKICFSQTKLQRIGEGEKEESVKFVGILIDDKLSWDKHKAHVHNKLQQQSYLISANKKVLSRKTKILLYNALIKPHLEYGLIAWGNTNLHNITTKQKKIIRHIHGTKNKIAHTNDMFLKLGILKIQDLVKLNLLRFAKQFTNMQLPTALQSSMQLMPGGRATRAKQDKHILIPRKTNRNWAKTPFHACPKLWNDTSSKNKNIKNTKTFTRTVKRTIIKSYEFNEKCRTANCKSCKEL